MSLFKNNEYDVARIKLGEKTLVIAQSNADFKSDTKHSVDGISWTGPFVVVYDGEKIE